MLAGLVTGIIVKTTWAPRNRGQRPRPCQLLQFRYRCLERIHTQAIAAFLVNSRQKSSEFAAQQLLHSGRKSRR